MKPSRRNNADIVLAVLRIIMQHDKDNPVKARVIAEQLSIPFRTVTMIIEQLKSNGHWVCASKGGKDNYGNYVPAGYYYARTRMELKEYQNTIISIIQDLAREMKAQRQFQPKPEQMELM